MESPIEPPKITSSVSPSSSKKRPRSESPNRESTGSKKRLLVKSSQLESSGLRKQPGSKLPPPKSTVSRKRPRSRSPLPESTNSTGQPQSKSPLPESSHSKSQPFSKPPLPEFANSTKRLRSKSPPPEIARQRKRPGRASRIDATQKEELRHKQLRREEEIRAAVIAQSSVEVVRQHYNAVPQRDLNWRKSGSKIAGLRKFNNWVKACLIQKYSRGDGIHESLRVLDLGCGKGGDLGKWQKAPRPGLDLYVGVDSADISIQQARGRYADLRPPKFHAEFFAKDGYGESLGEIPFIREMVGFENHGPHGGFDVVTMMFCMHYAFESESKAKGMLRNVAGSLRKGGRFIGVIPNSDVLRSRVEAFHKEQDASIDRSNNQAEDKEQPANPKATTHSEDIASATAEWGNDIYRVRFPGKTPKDGVFRPPFGWKYSYWMEEAVESIPEYVVPWEAFRA